MLTTNLITHGLLIKFDSNFLLIPRHEVGGNYRNVLSVCLYVCNIRVRVITYLYIDVLLYNVIQLCHIIMCSDLDPGLYLKGQGHTIYLKIESTHACVWAITYLCIDGFP